jgi:hypothetical protein
VTARRRPLLRGLRVLMRTLVGALVALLGLAVYLQVRGFPAWATGPLVRTLRSPYYAFEADAARLELPDTVTFSGVRVYRKRVPGPPAVEAERLSAALDLAALLAREPRLAALRVEGARLRPEMTQGPPPKFVRPRPPGRGPVEAAFAVTLRECVLRDVRIEDLACRLYVKGREWGVRDVDATLVRGEMRGWVGGEMDFAPEENIMDGRLTMHINPHVFLPWLETWNLVETAELIRRFDFGARAPRCEAEFRRGCEPGGIFESDARIWIEEAVYAGVETRRADLTLAIRNAGRSGTVTLAPLLVIRPEGIADITFTVDGHAMETRFGGVSSLDPHALTDLIGILDGRPFDSFTFEGPTHVEATGTVAFEEHARNRVQVTASGKGVRFEDFRVADYALEFESAGLTNRITDFRGRLCGGDLKLDMAFEHEAGTYSNTAWSARIDLRGAECRDFLEALAGDQVQDLKGHLAGVVEVRGPASTNIWSTMEGEGWLTISDGRVFSLPIFGGFSDIMRKLVPGLDFVLRQSDAKAEFDIARGRWHSERISIKGDVLSLTGRGNYHFDGRLDFRVRVTLLREHTLVAKILSALTYPLSKLFEFRLKGTVREPVWYPVNFSGDMLRRLGIGKEDEDPRSDVRLPDE